jgi:hypothetical protein
MADFKHTTPLEKYQLQVLTDAVRNYMKMVELPEGSRHKKSVLTFIGDRFRADSIQVSFVRTKKEDG